MDKSTYIQTYIQKKLVYKDEESLKYLLTDKCGRWFIFRLFEYCRLWHPLPHDKDKMLICEGRRRIALITYQSIKNLNEKELQKFDLGEKEFADCTMPLKLFTAKRKDSEAVKYLLSDETGRWYLSRLYESCNVSGISFFDIEKTNNMLIFEGKRQVAIMVNKIIDKLGKVGLSERQKAQSEYRDWLKQTELLARDDADKKIDEEQY